LKVTFRGKTGVNQWKYRNIIQDRLGGRDVANQDKVIAASEALNYCMLTLSDPQDDASLHEICDTYGIIEFDGMQDVIDGAVATGMTMAKRGESIDFNDMLFLPVFLNAKFPTYRNVFVDECQDLNALQREVVLKMQKEGGRTIAVGDPYQAIYGFAGADTDSFNRVREAINGKTMPLSVCYRCPTSHVELAQKIVPQIEASPNAIEGSIDDVKYDAIFTKAQPLANDLVLSRTMAPLVTLVFDFIKRRIPAKIRGRSDALKSIKALAKKVNAICEDDKTIKQSWLAFDQTLDFHQAEEEIKLKKRYPDDQRKLDAWIDRCQSLKALYLAAVEDDIYGLKDFENWMDQFFDENSKGVVVLSTVHRAKGLEADNVFILDVTKMPHPMAKTPEAYAQEMNLKYVALTRAKKTLTFVEAKYNLRGTNQLN
jgi:superfamily I DNA/RNA helicase